MGQYASNRSLKPTGRTLVRVVLTEEEALRILFLTENHSEMLDLDINEKLSKAKRYQEHVISRDN